MQKIPCPNCGRRINFDREFRDLSTGAPFRGAHPGMVVVCGGCAKALMVTPAHDLRELTDADALPADLTEFIEATRKLVLEHVVPVIQRKRS